MKIKTRTQSMQEKKCKTNLFYATYEIGWTWWNEQIYGARTYIRLVLNRLKVWGSYLYLYPFQDLILKNLHQDFYMPHIQRTFLKYKWTNESQMNFK
jgi:hypothetical protein